MPFAGFSAGSARRKILHERRGAYSKGVPRRREPSRIGPMGFTCTSYEIHQQIDNGVLSAMTRQWETGLSVWVGFPHPVYL